MMVSRQVGLSVALVLCLVLSTAPALAQHPPAEDAGVSASALPAMAAWFGQRVDRNAVGSGDDRGQYVSVAFLSGTPYVSYYDVTNTSLRIAWPVTSGGNCGAGNSWHCETVDDSADVGKYSSIAAKVGALLGSSTVGIAYYDATNGALKLAERNCVLGSCTWSIVTIEDLPLVSVGMYASLRYDSSGGRHIAYQAALFSTNSLRYAHSVSGGGNCGVDAAVGLWQCDIIDSGNGIGRYSSLDLNGAGQPRIAYYDDGNNILKYAVKGGAGSNCGPGGNTWVCRGIDVDPDVGRFASLAVSKGAVEKAQIAHYNATTGKLRYATYVGSGGNCGLNSITSAFEWQCDTIANMGAGLTQAGVSLALDSSDRPFIAYQDASDALGPARCCASRAPRPRWGFWWAIAGL